MFIRLLTCRNKDGTTRSYLHLLRSRRVNGKTRQELVCSLGRLDVMVADGSLDRLIEGLTRYSEKQWVQMQALEGGWQKVYGPVLVFRKLWEQLGLDKLLTDLQSSRFIQYPLDEAVFAMVLHRLLDPGSKRATHQWLESVYRPQFETLQLQHLYRALDPLLEIKDKVEESLFVRNCNLFALNADLVLFDTTLVHFEGKGPEGLADRARPGNYPDCVKVLVGLVLSGDGFPIAHHVFPGSTADISAFKAALKDLKQRFNLRRVIIVADRGCVSDELIESLETKTPGEIQIDYILGMRLRKNKEVREAVLRRAGRYHEVSPNLELKEVKVGDHRYVVCLNPEEEVRDRLVREEIIEHTRQELQARGVKTFVMPSAIRRYVELTGGELRLKEKVIKEDALFDGKWVLRTNTELPAEEVAIAYKSLWQIERTFRELKSGLEINPVYLRTEDHVRGHIGVCFLALVLEAALIRRLKKNSLPGALFKSGAGLSADPDLEEAKISYRDILTDLDKIRAVEIKANQKSWLVRTESSARAALAFQAAGIRLPPLVQATP
jgi:transposase